MFGSSFAMQMKFKLVLCDPLPYKVVPRLFVQVPVTPVPPLLKQCPSVSQCPVHRPTMLLRQMVYQPQPFLQAHHLEVYYLELQLLMTCTVKWYNVFQRYSFILLLLGQSFLSAVK